MKCNWFIPITTLVIGYAKDFEIEESLPTQSMLFFIGSNQEILSFESKSRFTHVMKQASSQQNEFVIVAALADLHEVETTAVAVALSAMARRRLSEGVVVAYTIAYDDVAPALALDAAMFDQALADAAAASGVAEVFDAVETVAFGGSEAPVAAASESEESAVVSDAAFRPLGRWVFLAVACLL